MNNTPNTPPPGSETPPGTGTPPVTGTPPGSGETPPTTTASIDDALKEIESLKAALKKTNAESASHRLKAKELDELKAKLESEKLSEKERLEKQIADMQQQRQEEIQANYELRVNAEVRAMAATMGVNPKYLDKVARFVDWEDIEIDDATGNPTNVRDIVRQLIEDMPELLVGGKPTPSSSGGATNPSRSQSTAPKELSWETISRMDAKEYEARRAEIQRWMHDHPAQFGQRLR